MSNLTILGDTSGSVVLQAPAVSGSTTITMPAATGTMMVSGNMPAFSAYQSSSTSVTNTTSVKILFGNEFFDTNNNFASSRFTPTIAGYYQISASVALNITGTSIVQLFMNTSTQVAFTYASGISGILPSVGVISKLLYFNGSTDFVEVFSYQNTGSTITTDTNLAGTWFTGAMVRAA